MTRAVLFDLDGTLHDRDSLVATLFDSQYDDFAAELSSVPRAAFIRAALAMDDHGQARKEEGYETLVRQLGLAPDLSGRLAAHFWARYDEFCHLPDDTATTLDTLRDWGMRLGVITNGGTERQEKKRIALGLLERMDVVLISEAEGVRKPSPEIFRRALARCGVESHEAVFVGDNPEADIEGALNAGLRPIWKRVPYWSLRTSGIPVIDTLSEILPLCGGEGRCTARRISHGL